MKTIRVKDKEFGLFISASEIDEAIGRIADKLNGEARGKEPVFLVVLNGAFMFAADLFKKLEFPCEVSFIKLASYQGTKSTSTVRELIGLPGRLEGRFVVIVEDIIDSGITIRHLMKMLHRQKVAGIRIASLLFKPDSFVCDYEIDYIGMKIPKEFIVGYGLDYDGHGRNYADIYKIIE